MDAASSVEMVLKFDKTLISTGRTKGRNKNTKAKAAFDHVELDALQNQMDLKSTNLSERFRFPIS